MIVLAAFSSWRINSFALAADIHFVGMKYIWFEEKEGKTCLRFLTLRPHPREELRRRWTLLGALRVLAAESRRSSQLTVVVLDQIRVLGPEKRLSLQGVVSVEVTRLTVACDRAWALLVGVAGQRRGVVVVEVLDLRSVLEGGAGARAVHHGGPAASQVLREPALVVVRT